MSQQAARALEFDPREFNPIAPEQLENPYPVYARARRERPVFHSPDLNLWIVTRYADITEVEMAPGTFSSAAALEASTEPHPEVLAVLKQGYVEFLSLVQSDPPDHTRVRAVFGKALNPQRVAAMEASTRALADSLIDSFVQRGEVDIIPEFAYALPGLVICDLLGLPRSDLRQLKRWSDAKQVLMSATTPVQHQVECARDFIAMQRYFAGHIEERRQRPGEDLLSLLVPQSMGGTAPISHQEAISNAIDLLAAGHETTTDLIGNGLALLLRSPEQLRALREDSRLIPNAIEEMLRMEAPVRGFFRTATRETQVGGVSIPRGARLFIVYASGNRDEDQFAMPDRFDIRREDAKRHLSFGKGIHFCLGAILARLEARIAFEHLLRRLPNLRFAPGGLAVRRPYFILRGFEHLSLAWDVPAA